MALVVKDRVRVSSTTAGTGALTLGAAITGFQSFSVIGNGNTTYYTIVDPTTGDWEVGIGTYNSTGPALSRDTILESSTGGTAVNFFSNPKDVFVTYPAERSVYVDGTSIAPASAARLGFTNLTQGSALSVLGVTGNATADVSSIAAGTDGQVLRRDGTALSFGAVALNQAAAITGTLPVGNGGTGITAFGTGVATALGQAVTGSGGIVLATSPTLVTPALGTPTSGDFSSGTFTWPTFNQSTTGNAATATALQTARDINGTSFNGTANITTANWGTARDINGVSINGSANYVIEPYVERDDSTAADRFLSFVDSSTAGYQRLNMDVAFTYNPGTGELKSQELVATNGIVVNSATVTSDYTIPSGSNASSAGPMVVASGITVTVSSGSVWAII